jgi:dephospho-CoA kinase
MSPGLKPSIRSSGYTKPVIGIAGGIGSGKSLVARAFAELGCGVIDSDAAARAVMQEPAVQRALQTWWPQCFNDDGTINRGKLAAVVFKDPKALAKLNGLIHPRVAELREKAMRQLLPDPQVLAIVWDTPLLLETGLDRLCDRVIFVKAPYEQRLKRVIENRRWTREELAGREKSQMPLDKKEQLADDIGDNSGAEAEVTAQVRTLFKRILKQHAARPAGGPEAPKAIP